MWNFGINVTSFIIAPGVLVTLIYRRNPKLGIHNHRISLPIAVTNQSPSIKVVGGRYGPSVVKPAANPGIEVRSQVKEATLHPRVASIISNCSKITLIKYNSCSIRLCARVIKKFVCLLRTTF